MQLKCGVGDILGHAASAASAAVVDQPDVFATGVFAMENQDELDDTSLQEYINILHANPSNPELQTAPQGEDDGLVTEQRSSLQTTIMLAGLASLPFGTMPSTRPRASWVRPAGSRQPSYAEIVRRLELTGMLGSMTVLPTHQCLLKHWMMLVFANRVVKRKAMSTACHMQSDAAQVMSACLASKFGSIQLQDQSFVRQAQAFVCRYSVNHVVQCTCSLTMSPGPTLMCAIQGVYKRGTVRWHELPH